MHEEYYRVACDSGFRSFITQSFRGKPVIYTIRGICIPIKYLVVKAMELDEKVIIKPFPTSSGKSYNNWPCTCKAVYLVLALLHFLNEVIPVRINYSVAMCIGMKSYAMTFFIYSFYCISIFRNLVSHKKKCTFNVISVKYIKKFSSKRAGTVIKSKIYHFRLGGIFCRLKACYTVFYYEKIEQ
jgi:hypothetical protein